MNRQMYLIGLLEYTLLFVCLTKKATKDMNEVCELAHWSLALSPLTRPL